MTSEEFAAAIAALKRQRDEINDQISDWTEAWIEDHHPCQIGDIVPATEYSRCAVDIRVDQRYIHPGYGGLEWRASGPIVGGDGQRAEWARLIFRLPGESSGADAEVPF